MLRRDQVRDVTFTARQASARRESRPRRSCQPSRKQRRWRSDRRAAERATTWCCPSARRGRCGVLSGLAGGECDGRSSAATRSRLPRRRPTARRCRSPFGVPWSKRMSTGWHGVGAEALSNEVENSRHLLACDVELLDDLVDAQVLEVLNDRGNRQTSAFEYPGATHLARDALDGRAPGPVKGCHCSDSLLQITAKRSSRQAGSR